MIWTSIVAACIAFAAVQITTIDAQAPCPQGWTRRDNNCYIVIPGRSIFPTARTLCQRLGGQVAWFASVDEMQFVNALAIGNGVTTYWIGLNRIGNVWTWANGTPATFTNWRRSQPDRCCGSNVTCVLANFRNQVGMWDDADCRSVRGNPQGYVCKT